MSSTFDIPRYTPFHLFTVSYKLLFRRNPNISLEHGKCGIGFLHTVVDVSVPLEFTRHCVFEMLGMVDHPKFVSVEGV